MKNTDQKEIETYLRRIQRNKVRISHHKIFIVMAVISLFIASLAKSDIIINNFSFVMFLMICLIGGDILMIGYHKWWIRTWRKKLTEITGADYDLLDSIKDEVIKEEQFKEFCDKYIKTNEEMSIIVKKENKLATKVYLFAMNTLLKDFCETKGILNSCKIEDLPYLKKFHQKRLANSK